MDWKAFVTEVLVGLALWLLFLVVVSFLTVRYGGWNVEDAVKMSTVIAAILLASGGFSGSMLAGRGDGFDLLRHLGAVVVAAIVVLVGFMVGVRM
ncbi:MAG: hypothetical protein V2I43_01595 [Parvularcula sp.]|jgi:hypothetical protein|nr:hypothetical protein [Parvularcula sp.]